MLKNKNFTIIIATLTTIIILIYIIRISSTPKPPGLRIINFSEKLSSKTYYDAIRCTKVKDQGFSTSVCLHDDNDIVSQALSKNYFWEGHIINDFKMTIIYNPDWMVFDIGAQIGEYTIVAATLKRNVIAVEPFYESVIRIQKAVNIENLQQRVTLIKNGISNIRNQIKRLNFDSNIGGQSLINYKNRLNVYERSDLDRNIYLVETIILDDLLYVLPKKPDGGEYTKAIMKIDIEGFEAYAFQNATKLFAKLDFQIIYMEWGHLHKQTDIHYMIEEMIQFLTNRGLKPYDGKKLLDTKNWAKWPFDVVWSKIY